MIVKGTEGPNTPEGNPSQVGVCESAHIINYLDDNFTGTSYLMKNCDQKIKERYEKLFDLHEAWDVEAQTIGNMLKNNIFVR